MNKIGRIFEIGYLVISGVFGYEAYLNWTEDRTRSYVLLSLMALAIFMFFFRRRFRMKREERLRQDK